jgi:hypothetical protein
MLECIIGCMRKKIVMPDGTLRRAMVGLGVLVMVSVFAACTAPPRTVENLQTATAQSISYCDLHVDGRWIKDPSGKIVVLHGANLPTITAMEASDYKPEARLRDLAAAGARAVRIPVDFNEQTPTFVPGKLSPLVLLANSYGMLVIVGWNVVMAPPIDDTFDDTESWLRQQIVYLSNNPGVWIELYHGTQDVTPERQRNIAQRLIDVLRGYKTNNTVLVNAPAWLLEQDPAVNKPLTGGNIVYGLDVMGEGAARWQSYDTGALPFIVTQWGPQSGGAGKDEAAFAAGVSRLRIGSLASVWDAAQQPNMVATVSPLTLTAFGQGVAALWKHNNEPGCGK